MVASRDFDEIIASYIGTPYRGILCGAGFASSFVCNISISVLLWEYSDVQYKHAICDKYLKL
jgi:hypothetical protein